MAPYTFIISRKAQEPDAGMGHTETSLSGALIYPGHQLLQMKIIPERMEFIGMVYCMVEELKCCKDVKKNAKGLPAASLQDSGLCALGSLLVALLTTGPQDINKQRKISGSSFLMPQHQLVFLQIPYWTSGVSNNLENINTELLDNLQDSASVWCIVQITAIRYTNSSLTLGTISVFLAASTSKKSTSIKVQAFLKCNPSTGFGFFHASYMDLVSAKRNSTESSLALAQAGCDYFNHPAFLHILDSLYFTQSLEHYMGIVNLDASTSDWVPLTHITNAMVANNGALLMGTTITGAPFHHPMGIRHLQALALDLTDTATFHDINRTSDQILQWLNSVLSSAQVKRYHSASTEQPRNPITAALLSLV
ncbi:hypothetical protein SERLADRAFT_405876 [Serpula lacrymans var. lacrymans S7.9]|uniref:Uncharacterized protein n=1 Tax=Serpula lacrymans var. lacrymans (strain S7.9) TaxID=578457 RepID=F8NJP4_SERL9|nr:uncharacterized protein SERLADRAFT_405876 [Serpula lacrymans var. lacrymans S7.9]EGO28259.1 hypothetical protein SERLADRAFT_405876 [Serpula lacrymans var. lacrymans S7.9]